MRLFSAIPFTLFSLLIYNGFAFTAGADNPLFWAQPVISIAMVSGTTFELLASDLLITLGLFFLFIEILKATRIGTTALLDHMFSVVVFVAYLVEFLVLQQAATSLFFILMVISLIDVIAGFSISITGARRDVSFGHQGN
ncbi:fumarate reductase subunit C [Labrenzia sp. EL_126]|nr:fumarate reductase subunit C [Labrenzia sp. EL_126]